MTIVNIRGDFTWSADIVNLFPYTGEQGACLLSSGDAAWNGINTNVRWRYRQSVCVVTALTLSSSSPLSAVKRTLAHGRRMCRMHGAKEGVSVNQPVALRYSANRRLNTASARARWETRSLISCPSRPKVPPKGGTKKSGS